jgi:tagatose 6-phosphate kinase
MSGTTNRKRLLVVGLSPAWQRSLVFDGLAMGKVNRALRVTEHASGKVINVARVASVLGSLVRMVTVAGGYHGELLSAAIRSEGIPGRVVSVAGPTRICQTLMAGDVVTELVEEAVPLTGREVSMVEQAVGSELSRAGLMVLTGSVPRGCGNEFYARLMARAGRAGVPVLVDVQGIQLLRAAAQCPLAVRITMDELAAATGVAVESTTSCNRAAQRLLALGARWVVVSDGARVVHGFSVRDSFRVVPPRVQARNPIGSGDSMMAGMAHVLMRGGTMIAAVQYGVACGSANAMTDVPGMVRMRDVRRLAKAMVSGVGR